MATAGDAPYDDGFYDETTEDGRRSARVVLPLVLELASITSAVDVGCGRGAWLSVLAELGVEDLLGLDGRHVDRRALRIDPAAFAVADLRAPAPTGRRFDLAMSLEVAEHLPASSAAGFVGFLCDQADLVLFSAAVPGQGGVDHVNEQWPAYWSALFAERGFRAFDVVRPRVWDRPEVTWYYAQNTLLYATGQRADDLDTALAGRNDEPGGPLRLVHPGMLDALAQVRARPAPQPSLRAVAGAAGPAVARAVRSRLAPIVRRTGTGSGTGADGASTEPVPWAVVPERPPAAPTGDGTPVLFAVIDVPGGSPSDAVEAVVARARALGCGEVHVVGVTGDPSLATAEAAGAIVVAVPAAADDDVRLDRLNQMVAEVSTRQPAPEVWWLHLQPGDDLTGPSGDDLPGFLAGLDHRVRIVGCTPPGAGALGQAAAGGGSCPGGHDRHPLLRFDRGGARLEAGPGFAIPVSGEVPRHEAATALRRR